MSEELATEKAINAIICFVVQLSNRKLLNFSKINYYAIYKLFASS